MQGFEDALFQLRRARYPAGLEMTPFRDLELQYMMWKAGVIRRQPGCGSVFRRTTLHRSRNPIYFSLADVYSVTHTLFYVTGFAGPPARLSGLDREKAVHMVEALVVHYWRKQDWDVTSELLLNMVALDRFDTVLFKEAFNAVMDAWRSDGTLPGPAFEPQATITRKEIFDGCYHTTLVGLLLCTAYLHRVKAGGSR
jgi:hypothetical protein